MNYLRSSSLRTLPSYVKKSAFFLVTGLVALAVLTPRLCPAQNATNASTASALADKTSQTLDAAARFYEKGQIDQALDAANAFLQAHPQSINGYILRGAIHSQKQDWDAAEKDYETALGLDAKNDGVRYDLADLKFKQKRFDDARAAFVPLQNNSDSDVSDLIKYKIYICDLADGHEDVAAKELDAFNQAGSHASYYFGNVAWNLFHKKTEEARPWLLSASRIYAPRKQLLYASILKDLGYLPLPPPPETK